MAKKQSIWKSDWLVALLVGVLFLTLFSITGGGLLDQLDLRAYDLGVRGTSRDKNAADRVALITIDEKSIKRLGRWPWSRTVHADMVNLLSAAGSKVIGLGIFFTEPQTDPGLRHIEALDRLFRDSRIAQRDAEFARQFEEALATAHIELDADAALTQAIAKSANVVLPIFLQPGRPLGRPDADLPDFAVDNVITNVVQVDPNASAQLADAVVLPVDAYGKAATGIGHLNLVQDAEDGGVRADALAFNYFGEHFPSLALAIAAKSLNLSANDISLRIGEGLTLGNLNIVAADRLRMLAAFYDSGDPKAPAIASYSFVEVLDGTIPASLFKDKIVLIGPTAQGLGDQSVTPISSAMHPVEVLANFVVSILNEDFYVRPSWAAAAELGMFVAITLYLMFLMPRLSAGLGAGVSFVLFATLLVAGYIMLTGQDMWLRTASPAALLLVGHLILTTKRFLVTERGKERAESASFEDNKMLGLSFQAQGQLDMALDKFRKIPMDDSVADLMYNLALDFERKRQFGKAVAIYDMILGYDKKFKDIAERKKRAANLEGTVILGGGMASGGTMVLDPTNKPTLGRYQVEKELGKGAMGIVYLGRDPKINRVVAIKTMALAQEFEGPELKEAKDRFFREAETAGRLNHPNIVTIYDAGEEQELAYIAMEFMAGNTLEDFCRPGSLMPPYSVMVVVSKIAEALDFAHSHGIVHRDIKPANVMLLKDKTVKVMDFGIARVTESSKTKTGVVMGTPSYMSPEQLSGAKVDGRSDLFSLGVMMFELLTGGRPFHGDSMATLMYSIAQQPHDRILEVNPNLPPCVGAIIDKALAKNLDNRYAAGKAMAADIVACAKSMKAATATMTASATAS